MSFLWMKYLRVLLLVTALIGFTACKNNSGSAGKIKDVDGNTYRTVRIGEQVWMAENLKATHLKDGSPIRAVENYDEWSSLSLPAYCWYNNDISFRETYGALYNWFVVETGKLCPEGWHVPTDEDWIELETYYGGAILAGGSLKASGTEFWKTPNEGANKTDVFLALPGGYRSYTGTFNLWRIAGYWWSSTEKNWYAADSRVLYRNLNYNARNMVRDIAEQTNGFSVRCVKDR